MNNNCQQLLQRLSEVSFALDDVTLFLDTHPCDQNALAYYHHVAALREDALSAYESACGPMLIDQVPSSTYWNWVDDKWPWEGGFC